MQGKAEGLQAELEQAMAWQRRAERLQQQLDQATGWQAEAAALQQQLDQAMLKMETDQIQILEAAAAADAQKEQLRLVSRLHRLHVHRVS